MFLQIWQSDGKIVNIDLDEQPVTTYSDGNLVITTTKAVISYPLEKVAKYTYFSADGISNLESMRTKFSQDGETLIFTGLEQGTEIAVYASSGQMMHRTKVKRRFMLARNRRIDLGPLGHEEVAKCLRIRQFSGFRVFGGLRELRSSGAIRMHQPRTKTFVRGIIIL